jgi:hypothetical protein
MGFWILIGFISAAAVYLRLRRRVAAKNLTPRRAEVVTNPYKAVTIVAGRQACKAAWNLADQSYLASEAPPLPLPSCRINKCTCHYEYHEDRREVMNDRRGSNSGLQRNFAESEGLTPRESKNRRDS